MMTNVQHCAESERSKEVPAIVLAGGLGTRLRTAYSGPKCMAPVRGRPFLEYLVSSLRCAGFSDLLLCVGYKRSLIQRYFRGGRKWGVRIRYSSESKLLGTAGALRPAWKMLDTDCAFVLNGDTYVSVNLRAMLEFHRRQNSLATVALVEVPDAARYGTVNLDRRGRIVGFLEKHSSTNAHNGGSAGLINAGVYLLNSEFLAMIPRGRAVSLERDVFPHLVNDQFFGFVTSGFFIDIGIPEDLQRAAFEMPECRQ